MTVASVHNYTVMFLKSTAFNLNDSGKDQTKSEKITGGPTPRKRARKPSGGKGECCKISARVFCNYVQFCPAEDQIR